MRVGNAYGDTTLYIGNSKEVMMSKYIVKNCPAMCTSKYFTGECRLECTLCKDITDCLIKQVIDDCNESIKHYENEGWKSDDCLKLCGEASMSFKLLQLFEIKECKDED